MDTVPISLGKTAPQRVPQDSLPISFILKGGINDEVFQKVSVKQCITDDLFTNPISVKIDLIRQKMPGEPPVRFGPRGTGLIGTFILLLKSVIMYFKVPLRILRFYRPEFQFVERLLRNLGSLQLILEPAVRLFEPRFPNRSQSCSLSRHRGRKRHFKRKKGAPPKRCAQMFIFGYELLHFLDRCLCCCKSRDRNAERAAGNIG